tara:strand:+ start:599 stop:1126 length:528 start_codon:yes stop_codon:yes gene_type:complete
MISDFVWDSEWRALEERWAPKPPEMQIRYHEFCDAVFESDSEFVQACAAVYSSREFFPRPIDFLMVRASADFLVVMDAITNSAQWSSLSPAGKRALRLMGGSHAVASSRSGWDRLRDSWLTAYSQAVEEQAATLPHVQRRALGSQANGDQEGEGIVSGKGTALRGLEARAGGREL